MFDNVGSKLKSIAKIYFWIVTVGSLVLSIIFFCSDDIEWYGAITLIVGPLSAWISSCFLYAFGELVENTAKMKNKLINMPTQADVREKKEANSTIMKESIVTKPVTVVKPKISKGTCEMCETENVDLLNCVIKDEYGTRYRKLCVDCMAVYKAKILD